MSHPRIVAVVEGQGEIAAVPVLLTRLVTEIACGTWVEVARPFRIGRGSLIKAGGVENMVATIAEQGGPQTGVLILLDADDDCPHELGPQLLARAGATRSDRPASVVLAKREFEAWFLAAAPSLSGRRGLAPNLAAPQNPELPRDCKGWLSKHRTDGRSYKPTADQAALAAMFDMRMARDNSPSFDKLWRDVERLVRETT